MYFLLLRQATPSEHLLARLEELAQNWPTILARARICGGDCHSDFTGVRERVINGVGPVHEV